jgi:hypothetical protein
MMTILLYSEKYAATPAQLGKTLTEMGVHCTLLLVTVMNPATVLDGIQVQRLQITHSMQRNMRELCAVPVVVVQSQKDQRQSKSLKLILQAVQEKLLFVAAGWMSSTIQSISEATVKKCLNFM